MGAADCDMCEMAGYRTCDCCGQPYRPGLDGRTSAFGVDVCAECDPLDAAVEK